MSTIATLTAAESGSASLTDINANFSALNTDKAEISTAIFVDQETANTAGGGAGADTTAARVLNTTLVNGITGCSLASNQITLPVGSYIVRAEAPAYLVDKSKLRFYNVTDASYSIEGMGNYTDATNPTPNQSTCVLIGKVTITGIKVFELRQWTQTAKATNGLGLAMNQSSEIYAQIHITKYA